MAWTGPKLQEKALVGLINKDKLITLLAENHSKARIAKSLGISKATLYKKLSELR
jgi:transcriptional regulator with PAS, ATPase and Fis domain